MCLLFSLFFQSVECTDCPLFRASGGKTQPTLRCFWRARSQSCFGFETLCVFCPDQVRHLQTKPPPTPYPLSHKQSSVSVASVHLWSWRLGSYQTQLWLFCLWERGYKCMRVQQRSELILCLALSLSGYTENKTVGEL